MNVHSGPERDLLGRLAAALVDDDIRVPIRASFGLDDIAHAFAALSTPGIAKIALSMKW